MHIMKFSRRQFTSNQCVHICIMIAFVCLMSCHHVNAFSLHLICAMCRSLFGEYEYLGQFRANTKKKYENDTKLHAYYFNRTSLYFQPMNWSVTIIIIVFYNDNPHMFDA